MDIGPADISVTYEDKHRESAHFFCPSEFFADWFQFIKQMILPCEEMPAVLQTDEDFEEDPDGESLD